MANIVPSITEAEHIGPQATGDNIEAKRTAGYHWNGTNWERDTASPLIPANYDYVAMDPSSAAPTTMTFKVGGASGTTIATLTLVYSGTDIVSISRT